MRQKNKSTGDVQGQARKTCERKGRTVPEKENLFTVGVCRKLRSRRRELGVSYAQLGFFLGVHWSTVRNWERGGVMACNARIRPALLAFLAGENDDAIRLVINKRHERKQKRDYPDWAQGYFARVRMTFELCYQKPDLQRQMIRSINERIFRLIGDFASHDKFHTE